jgi:hypothetical protein
MFYILNEVKKMSNSENGSYCIKIGGLYVSPIRVKNKGPLPLVTTPHVFHKNEVRKNWFSLKSLENKKYVRSAGGNNIVCDRDKIGDDEQFKIKKGKIFCTTGGEKDKWYSSGEYVNHFKSKKGQRDDFKLIALSDMVDVVGSWTLLKSVDNTEGTTAIDVEHFYETSVKKSLASTNSTSVKQAIETGIEVATISASVSTSIEVSQEITRSLINSNTETLTVSYVLEPGEAVYIYQYKLTSSYFTKDYEIFSFDEIKFLKAPL